MTDCTAEGNDVSRGNDHTSIDETMEALGNWRRRALLVELFDVGVATVEELTETLAARRPRKRVDRDEVRLQLLHTDLPKLADVGIVTLDPDATTVTLAGEQRRVRRFLEAVSRWHE